MAYTSTQLQSYIDAGYVPSTSGTSELTTQVTFDGSQKVYVAPGKYVWTGSSSSWPFLLDKSVADPYPIVFDNVDVVSNVDGSPIMKPNDNTDKFHNMTFVGCDWTSLGAYCWDFNGLDYTVLPTWQNIITRGSGALRLRGSGGSDYWHCTSEMTIRGWTHIGANRWGPAFNLRGCSGLIMENVSDTGSLALHSTLRTAGWTGPLSILVQALRTPNHWTNFHVDYDEVNDDDAPNCYIGEIRTDLDTGTGQQEVLNLINPTMRHAAIDSAVKPWRFMGSDDSSAHSMLIRIVDADSPTTDDFLLGGKCALWFERPHYKNGEGTDLSTLKTYVETIFTASGVAWQDAIVLEDGKLPAGAFSGGVTYSGSSLESAYLTETSQPEDVL